MMPIKWTLTNQFCRVLVYEVFTEPDEHRRCLFWRALPVTETNRTTLAFDTRGTHSRTKTQLTQFMTPDFLLPFALKLHIFDPFFFNVPVLVEAGGVRQIHKQTHFHLKRKRKRHTEMLLFHVSSSILPGSASGLLTFRLFKKLDSMLGWNRFSSATWSSYLGPNIVFIGRNLPAREKYMRPRTKAIWSEWV